jgi:hypothetical protein
MFQDRHTHSVLHSKCVNNKTSFRSSTAHARAQSPGFLLDDLSYTHLWNSSVTLLGAQSPWGTEFVNMLM